MRLLTALLLALAFTSFSYSQQNKIAREKQVVSLRPVHTFSIVARDPETGELGVAVQSHWFSVGSFPGLKPVWARWPHSRLWIRVTASSVWS
jgi:hypothetical protein